MRMRSFGGPGVIITAAFIGPGTVTMCTIAGAKYGIQLLWTVLLSTAITILFQEMAMRIGMVTNKDLPKVLRDEIQIPWLKYSILALVISAIVIGNAAYEAGNISGGALGFNQLFAQNPERIHGTFFIGFLAFLVLWSNRSKVLENLLTGLVLIMSLAFLIGAISISPDAGQLLSGFLIPIIPNDDFTTIIGLVGTTVVPYNLFLHASLAREKWKNVQQLPKARKDLYISLAIGGLISSTVLITASNLQGQEVKNSADLSQGLEKIYGSLGRYLVSIGIFAAGLTSAITAPLAAAYVLISGLGKTVRPKSGIFRWISSVIVVIGIGFSVLGAKPVQLIKFAQITNGMLIPIIATLLIWLGNRHSLLGPYRNNRVVTSTAVMALLALFVLGGMKMFG